MGSPVGFLVILAVLASIHIYLWIRLVRDTRLPPLARRLATIACALLGISVPVAMITFRRLTPDTARLLSVPGFVWLGLTLFLCFMLAIGEVVRLVIALRARLRGEPPLDPTRRIFLGRALGGGATAAAVAVAGYAVDHALTAPAVKEVTVELALLPEASDGTTIVQLTDMHVGPTIGRSFVESVVRRVNALAPDLVAITGDLIDGSVASLRHAVEPLGDLRPKHGVFFVTGNHEYYSGARPWLEELERLGIRPLRNERVDIPTGGGGFDLAGVHDWTAYRFDEGHRADLNQALKGRDRSRELVLLAHQPRAIFGAARAGVGLQLSGHTHAGQIWPFGTFVRIQQPFVAGLHRVDDTSLYISAGTGYYGPPMRVGTTAEITRLTLRRARTTRG